MTLTTHAIVGAAAASLFPQSAGTAFIAGFLSHLAIDAIPHWDYEIVSLRKDLVNELNSQIVSGKHLLPDVIQVLGDTALGFALSALILGVWLFQLPIALILMGAFGALVPDGLHAIYFRYHPKVLEPLERFHIWIQQANSPLKIPAWEGIGLQAALVIVVLAALKLFI